MNKNLLNIVILAAGKGTRMKSEMPKVFHKVAGKSMLDIVITEAKQVNFENNIICVVSDEIKEKWSNLLPNDINFVLQENQLGTADAVKTAINSEYCNINAETTLVLYGDTPLITAELLSRFLKLKERYDVAVLSFEEPNREVRYGRVFVVNDSIAKVGDDYEISEIKEFKDFQNKSSMPTICNGGIMFCKTEILKDLLLDINNNNANKEFYLTDIIQIAKERNYKCGMLMCDENDILGANSQYEMSILENKMQLRIREQMMNNGVKFLDQNTVYISHDAEIEQDSVIEPNVYIGCGVKIGKNVTIKSFSYLEGAEIRDNSSIGPFARIRPDTVIERNVRIGNFVEIKNSQIMQNSKANHLCYIGDAEIGEGVNFGAGSVICNYDGKKKHKTVIEKNAFIGSNSAIIAPCIIQEGAVIAAGSVISKIVKKFSLAIARARQTEIENWNKNS